MLIVAGWFEVSPNERDRCVEMHDVVIRGSRAAPGCLDLSISADPLQAGRVNVFELWESEEHLDAWRAVAPAPRSFTPIIGGQVKKYQISASGPAFG